MTRIFSNLRFLIATLPPHFHSNWLCSLYQQMCERALRFWVSLDVTTNWTEQKQPVAIEAQRKVKRQCWDEFRVDHDKKLGDQGFNYLKEWELYNLHKLVYTAKRRQANEWTMVHVSCRKTETEARRRTIVVQFWRLDVPLTMTRKLWLFWFRGLGIVAKNATRVSWSMHLFSMVAFSVSKFWSRLEAYSLINLARSSSLSEIGIDGRERLLAPCTQS